MEVLVGLKESCVELGKWTSTVWRLWFWRLKDFGEVQVESWLMSDDALFQFGLLTSLSRDTDRKKTFD